MNKFFEGLVGVVCGFGLLVSMGAPAQASSLTSAQVQAIVGLLQSFGADTSVIANVQATLNGSTTITNPLAPSLPSIECPLIQGTLVQGATGDSVTQLQQFLAKDSTVYPEGRVTGYFGPATAAAVARWQTGNGVVVSTTDGGAGIVGPKTRAAIFARCGGGQTNEVPPPSGQIACPAIALTCPSGQYDQVGASCSHTCVNNPTSSVPPVACPADAMLCSNGNYVGRTGPSCAFATCPSGGSTSGTSIPPSTGGGTGVSCTLPPTPAIGCTGGATLNFVPSGTTYSTGGICSGSWKCVTGL